MIARLGFADQAAFAAWLEENAETTGRWLRIAKKGTGIESVDHDQALEEALRHGWIDGTARRVDDQWFVQKFTPRTRRSRWSKINRDVGGAADRRGSDVPARAARGGGGAGGRPVGGGLRGPGQSTVPDDLAAALAASPTAAAFFKTLTSQNRYAILYRVEEAKRPETRARRIEKFVGMLERGETVH